VNLFAFDIRWYNIKLKVQKFESFRWGWFTGYKTKSSRNTRMGYEFPIILSFPNYYFRMFRLYELEPEEVCNSLYYFSVLAMLSSKYLSHSQKSINVSWII
jgi:hypothetical protein